MRLKTIFDLTAKNPPFAPRFSAQSVSGTCVLPKFTLPWGK